MKKKSEQAIRDEKRASIIQDANSTAREKEKAYSDLFHEHSKQLKVFFLQRTKGDVNMSEDLLVDAFRKVYENFDKFDSEKGVFSTWLYRIATNNLIDHTRKITMEVFSLEAMIGKTTEENEGMEYQITSDSLNPEEELSNTALGQEIQDAIYELPDKLVKEVMIELYINELSFKEIEDKLGFEEGCSTPRVSANRGRRILAKKLSHLREFAR
ncbi:MAG: sigma-70 family RNA polymerase sigma factor [Candidatus Heimdallarchaeaceae archaeon]